MYQKQDPYSYISFSKIYDGGKEIGFIAYDYQVSLYNDVQVTGTSSVEQPQNQQFIVTCKQRIFIKNTNSSTSPIVVSEPTAEAFENYPAQISAYMSIPAADGLTLNLLDYSPQTVNTAVQQTNSSGSSSNNTTGTSSSSTTGSSYSQSSNYGTSVTAGNMSGVTHSSEHSTTVTTEKSSTTGSESSNSAGRDSSSGSSMSIKDWGSYGSVNPFHIYPTWTFGQEFPWNAIECRYANKTVNPNNSNQINLYISSSMQGNLYDGVFLYPPSELSIFGLSFVMSSTWRVYVDYGSSTEITLNHVVDYYSASHSLSETTDDDGATIYVPNVYLDGTPSTLKDSTTSESPYTVSNTINLNIMALDPIGVNTDAAIIGFLPTKFIPPAAPAAPGASVAIPEDFLILASTNDLQIQDATDYPEGGASGFSVSQTCLTATWDPAKQYPYSIIMYFKIIDSINDYDLHIKGWKNSSSGVILDFVINEDENNTITKYVDALEAEGGDNNIINIALRNLDFSSIDYHDYLQLGLNSIKITMRPIDAGQDCSYQMRAVSITKG